MALEIERRFLVNADKVPDLSQCTKRSITQGYLSNDGDAAVVRIRAYLSSGYMIGLITIKTQVSHGTNAEYEYNIPYVDALKLLESCGDKVVAKDRYLINNAGTTIELDYFHKQHDGIVLAEIELDSIDQEFNMHPLLGKEITGVKGLSNFAMALHPAKAVEIFKGL
jgi:CYTH domain-containing protein